MHTRLETWYWWKSASWVHGRQHSTGGSRHHGHMVGNIVLVEVGIMGWQHGTGVRSYNTKLSLLNFANGLIC